MVERYLWSHFSDLCAGNSNDEVHATWASCLTNHAKYGLDAGCSVGRITFELAKKCNWAVGCDLSRKFIGAARNLAEKRQVKFSLPLEGNLRETFEIKLPDNWRVDNVEFVVADVMRLPFARKMFQQAVTLNVLDRVRYPLAHLYEIGRVSSDQGTSLLLSSPFSWAESSTPEEYWLGGKLTGQFAGRGVDNVRMIFENVIIPPWQISHSGTVTWKMRSHCNHVELITSNYMVATR